MISVARGGVAGQPSGADVAVAVAVKDQVNVNVNVNAPTCALAPEMPAEM